MPSTGRSIFDLLFILFAICLDAQPVPSMTLLWGDGISFARAGEESTFYVQTRNAYGYLVSAGSSRVDVSCVSDPGKLTDFCIIDPAVTPNGGGRFTVTFVVGRFWADDRDPWGEGIYPNPLPSDFYSRTNDRLHVKVDGQHVPGSPFALNLLGALDLFPYQSTIDFSSSIMVAGYSAGLGEFWHIRDAFGNTIRPLDAPEYLTGHLTIIEPAMPIENPVEVEVTDAWILTNWYIDFKAICYTAGRYSFEVKYSKAGSPPLSVPIERFKDGWIGNQLTIDCAPNRIDSIDLRLQSETEIDTIVKISAKAYDRYGNAAYYGDAVKALALSKVEDQTLDDVEVLITHAGCSCSKTTTLDLDLGTDYPGQLEIRFSTNEPGTHHVRVLYKGVDYVNQPLTLEFEAPPEPVVPAPEPEVVPVPEPSLPVSVPVPALSPATTPVPAPVPSLVPVPSPSISVPAPATYMSPTISSKPSPSSEHVPYAEASVPNEDGPAPASIRISGSPERVEESASVVPAPSTSSISPSAISMVPVPVPEETIERVSPSPSPIEADAVPTAPSFVDPSMSKLDASSILKDGRIIVHVDDVRTVYLLFKDTLGRPIEGDAVEATVWLIDRDTPETGLKELRIYRDAAAPLGTYNVELMAEYPGLYDLIATYKGIPVQNDIDVVEVLPPAPVPTSPPAPPEPTLSPSPIDHQTNETSPPEITVNAPASSPLPMPVPSLQPVSEEVDPSKSEVDASFLAGRNQIVIEVSEILVLYMHLRNDEGEPIEGRLSESSVWLINREAPDIGIVELTTYKETDAPLGTYAIQLTCENPGDYDLLVTYKGIPIQNTIDLIRVLSSLGPLTSSPVSVTAVPSTSIESMTKKADEVDYHPPMSAIESSIEVTSVDTTTSEVIAMNTDGSGEIHLKAGFQTTILVQLRDVDRQPVQGNVDDLDAWLIDRANPEQGLLRLEKAPDNTTAVGSYVVVLSSTKATLYDLLITYEGITIQHEIASVVVSPSDSIDPALSIIEGSAIGVEVAGSNLSLIVAAVDPFGNPVSDINPGFELGKEVKWATHWVQTFEFGDGKTRFYFLFEVAGIYNVSVYLNGETVYEAVLEIIPGAVDYSNCRLYGLEETIAGEQATAFIEVQDTHRNIFIERYRNLIDVSKFRVSFALETSPDAVIPATYTGYATDDNAFAFVFDLSVSGTYAVLATWDSQWSISGTRTTITVLPSSWSPSMTRISNFPTVIHAGEDIAIEITLRDRFGNLATRERDLTTRTLFLIAPRTNEASLATIVMDSTTSGIVRGQTNLILAAIYEIRGLIDGIEIQSPADTFTVVPLRFNDSTSTVDVDRDIQVDHWTEIYLFPRDQYGNPLSALNLDDLGLHVNGTGNVVIHAFNRSEVHGRLLGRFRVEAEGNYTLTVTHGSRPIEGYPIVINAQDLNPSKPTPTKNPSVLFIDLLWSSNATLIGIVVAAGILLIVGYRIVTTKDSESVDDDDDVEWRDDLDDIDPSITCRIVSFVNSSDPTDDSPLINDESTDSNYNL